MIYPYAVIAREGWWRDETDVQSRHRTAAAAIREAKRQRVTLPGGRPQSMAMVIQSADGWQPCEPVYSDTLRSLYPVIW